MRIAAFLLVLGIGGTTHAQMRRQTDVLNPWGPPSMQSSMSSTTMSAPPTRPRPRIDPHVGSTTHFPYVILSESNVLDPFIDEEMSARERELLAPVRRVQARLARCVRNGRGLMRYELRLSPTRVRRGRGASCLTRVLRSASLPGSGRYELVLDFVHETPAGVYVVDRDQRNRRRAPPTMHASTRRPSRPRLACHAPVVRGSVRRTGDHDHFPDFVGMRAEAVHRHQTGPIAEAACRGLHPEVLNPWTQRNPRTGAPNEFERDWARRVRQRKVLILACIPSAQRPPSWALTFQVDSDGKVRPLDEATVAMASCIESRISAPPRPYRLHVSFAETPEELYVDTR